MTAELDPVIHPTHRLKICAMLATAPSIELSLVKDHVGLSASALSKQVAALVDVGYVRQDRAGHDSRRVALSLTKDGRRAYRDHVRALRAIVSDAHLSEPH